MKLICTGQYHNTASGLRCEVGDVLDVAPGTAAYLLHDAPGCFVLPLAPEAAGKIPAPGAPAGEQILPGFDLGKMTPPVVGQAANILPINLADGVDDGEAKTASKALNARRKKKA